MHTNEGTANRKRLVSSTSSTGLQHPRTYIWAGPLALSQRMTPPQLQNQRKMKSKAAKLLDDRNRRKSKRP